MVYVNGVGYVDERSYNASKKLTSNNRSNFNSILEKEMIVYAVPESNAASAVNTLTISSNHISAPAELEEYFQKAAQQYGIDVNLLKAVAKQESNFDAGAVSSVGAAGVMQLMPSTAQALGVTNIMDPEQNILGGAKYLSQMLNTFHGDVSLALAAYNAGPGNVKKYGGIPPFSETQNYVNSVLTYLGENTDTADNLAFQTANDGSNRVHSIFAVAVKDATQIPKVYSVQVQSEEITNI